MLRNSSQHGHADERSRDRAHRRYEHERPNGRELSPLRREVDGHSRCIDDESDRRGGRHEGLLLDIETKECRGANPALVAHQAAEDARNGSRDSCDGPAESDPARKPRELARADENENDSEHYGERSIRGERMEQSASQSTRRAGDAEAHEDAAIDVLAQSPESERGREDMRNGDRGDCQLSADAHREQWREQAPDSESNNRGYGAREHGDDGEKELEDHSHPRKSGPTTPREACESIFQIDAPRPLRDQSTLRSRSSLDSDYSSNPRSANRRYISPHSFLT